MIFLVRNLFSLHDLQEQPSTIVMFLAVSLDLFKFSVT